MENSVKKVAIISHVPTEDQGVWVTLPEELKKIWGDIPPYGDEAEVLEKIKPILDWLDEMNPEILWVQGEMTAVSLIWAWCRKHHATTRVVVATTKRDTISTTLPDGSVVKKAVFKHCLFRQISLT